MTTDLATHDQTAPDITVADREQAAGALAHVLGTGDLYQLTNEQRVAHYLGLCRRRGLNPLGRPYQWIEFKEGDAPPILTLYLKVSGAAEILRNNHVSVHYPTREIVGELFKVEAHGTCPDGREGWATKYVPLTNRYGRLQGRQLANAYMTAESGAMRRLAIAMFGGGDEPDGDMERGTTRTVYVDGTGALLDHPTEQQKYLAEHPEAARVLGEPTYESTAEGAAADAVAAYGDDLATSADSAPRAEEIRPRRRSGPAARLRPSDADVSRWRGQFFARIKGCSLDDREDRHRFVRQWSGGRTESITELLSSMTDRQADDFLAHVGVLMDEERAAIAAAADEQDDDEDETGAF